MDKKNISVTIDINLDLTATIITGIIIVVTGLISAAVTPWAGKEALSFAGTCITIGAGLVGLGKGFNTLYDNAHAGDKNAE